ncbi:MAG: hypothetical protein ACRCWI_00075 [Brevinema sp.]
MIEFLRDLCDSEEEFLLIGLWLNKVVSNNKNRYLYIPKSLKRNRVKNGKKYLNVQKLYRIILQFTPDTASFKIRSLIRDFRGNRIYIPVVGAFTRMLRNEKLYKYRELGLSYQELGTLLHMETLAVRRLQYLYNKSQRN